MLESLLIKLQTLQPGALFQPHPEQDFNTSDSCENCEISPNSFSYGTPPEAAFVSLK